jgi:hypothetical protein
MTATGNVSRATHRAVVELATGYLQQSGLAVLARPYSERISDAIAAPIDGDVRGLENVFVNVTSRLTHRLDLDLAAARMGADIARKDVGLFIQWRQARSVGDAYAVMSLRDLAKLLGGTPPP